MTHRVNRRPILIGSLVLPLVACSGESDTNTSRLLVTEGDSLTGGKDSWANQLDGVKNQATPGDQLRLMSEQAPFQIDPLFEPGAIATLWAGTNDLTIFPEASANWFIEHYSEWGLGRQAAGFKVIGFTMMPRLKWTVRQKETQLNFNDWLSRGIPGIDLVVDTCGVPGSLGDGLLYRPDGIHLTFQGQTWLLENRVKPALEKL